MVSIIVPIYNSEKYLDRCIDSMTKQTLPDLEIILVDDGSKDGSLSICQAWAERDNRIKVVSQFNQGVSEARNTGLSLASGSAIMFLDSDDYMKPEMCAVMMKKMQDTDADLVVCGTEENDGTRWKPSKDANFSSLRDFQVYFVQLLNSELLSPPWNKIYKKEKISSKFAANVSFGEDLIFNLSYIANCQKITFITDCLHFHEKDNVNSLARNFHDNRLMDIEALQHAILDFAGENNDKGIMTKYIKDIIVHTKLLLLNQFIPLKRKIELLNDWKEITQIQSMHIKDSSLSFKNKIYLCLLVGGFWHLAYYIIKWKQ